MSGTRRLEKFAPPEASPPPAQWPSARALDRDPGVEQLRTRLARKFTTLADEVTDSFVDFRIGAGAWAVELTAPDGMSTSGGKQALQHLRLRPTREGHAVLVGGVVNAVARTAELRDYAHIDTIYRARFGRAIEITSGEWEQFLRKAEVVLHEEDIRTSRMSAPHDMLLGSRSPAAAATGWQTRVAALALALVVLLVTLVGWRVALVLWR